MSEKDSALALVTMLVIVSVSVGILVGGLALAVKFL